MSGVKKIWVHCKRDGQVIASYDFGLAESLGPSSPPERSALILEAKTNLTNQGIAFPPYDGITFDVRYR